MRNSHSDEPNTMRQPIYNDDDRQYLQMMHENIARMAGNSANCKTWLVTLVSGLLAIGASIETLNGWLFLTLLPIFIFWSMDAYYLKLERGMRNRERLFINIVNAEVFNDKAYREALFDFKPYDSPVKNEETGIVATEKLEWTDSVCPFYATALLVAMVIAVTVLLIH